MESFTLPHLPRPISRVHIAQFASVANAPAIRKRLIAASQAPEDADGDRERAAVDAAFLEGTMLASKQQLLIAIHQALLAWSGGKGITKTVHSEIMHCLSVGNNITESIKRHGLSDATTSLVVVHVTDPSSATGAAPSAYELMSGVVDGVLVPLLEEGREEVDWKRIDKVYKLGDMGGRPTEADKIRVIQTNLAIKSGASL